MDETTSFPRHSISLSRISATIMGYKAKKPARATRASARNQSQHVEESESESEDMDADFVGFAGKGGKGKDDSSEDEDEGVLNLGGAGDTVIHDECPLQSAPNP